MLGLSLSGGVMIFKARHYAALLVCLKSSRTTFELV